MTSTSTSTIPSYISLPQSAIRIPAPSITTSTSPQRPISLARTSIPSFPLTSIPPTIIRKFSVPTASSVSSNVSDLLLGSLLPPNLPKLPNAAGRGGGSGRPRELSTQSEALSLPLVSNNFRRFVTKVGPVFWVQDRLEEVLFWRKPRWTWAWIMLWTFISFKPRLLLLIPSLTLTLLLLHAHERTNPLPSLLGVSTASASAGRTRVGPSTNSDTGKDTFSTSTGPDGQEIPVVPPKEVESGVDYYMNLQAIQNLMGLVSDIYDYIAPRLTYLTSPFTTPTPTSFPLTQTHLILSLLPPALLLPLLPASLLPFVLLPLGIAPPLIFHPNLTTAAIALPRHPAILKTRAILENLALTDALTDDVGRKDIGRVEVWENERLDPSIASKPPVSTSSVQPLPGGAWSSRHLRGGERAPWVKVINPDNGNSLWRSSEEAGAGEGEKIVLALEERWAFITSEDWRVDVCGIWSGAGTDEDGWAYSDDSWQNQAATPMTESDPPNSTSGTQNMPALALRRVTRRRRWWRRAYLEREERNLTP